MPAKSKRQKKLMCIALSIKRGETPRGYSEQAAKLADSMSEQSLTEYCESPVEKK